MDQDRESQAGRALEFLGLVTEAIVKAEEQGDKFGWYIAPDRLEFRLLIEPKEACKACKGTGKVKAPPGDVARWWPCGECERS